MDDLPKVVGRNIPSGDKSFPSAVTLNTIMFKYSASAVAVILVAAMFLCGTLVQQKSLTCCFSSIQTLLLVSTVMDRADHNSPIFIGKIY